MCRFLFAASPPFVLFGLLLTVFSTNTLLVHCGGGGDNPPSFGEEEMRGSPIQQTDIEESTTEKPPLEQSKKDGKKLFDGFKGISQFGMKVGSTITKGAHEVNQLVVSPARQKAGQGAKFVYEKATNGLKPKSTAESAEAKDESANSSRRESGDEKQNCQNKANAAERQGEQSVDEQPKEGHLSANDESASEEKPLNGESSGAKVAGTANAGRKCPVPAIAKKFVSMTGKTVGPPVLNVGGKVAQATKPVLMATHNNAFVPAAQGMAYVTRKISNGFEMVTKWEDDKQKKKEKKEEEEEKKDKE
ncbi:hypothetical protein niasHT_035393 [Heterodera trifolii]|uniref:Uncharacterized protein n=1 Tax=Heterodera trifolii TaxID=157864 RepID=A0ABD2HYV7_9BILA